MTDTCEFETDISHNRCLRRAGHSGPHVVPAMGETFWLIEVVNGAQTWQAFEPAKISIELLDRVDALEDALLNTPTSENP